MEKSCKDIASFVKMWSQMETVVLMQIYHFLCNFSEGLSIQSAFRSHQIEMVTINNRMYRISLLYGQPFIASSIIINMVL